MVCCKRTQCIWKLGFQGACIGVVLSAWSAIIAGGGAEAWSFISKRGFALHPIKGAACLARGKLHASRQFVFLVFTQYINHINLIKPTYYLPSTLPYPFLPYYRTMTMTMTRYHDQIPWPYHDNANHSIQYNTIQHNTEQYNTEHTITYNYIQIHATTCNYMQLHATIYMQLHYNYITLTPLHTVT